MSQIKNLKFIFSFFGKKKIYFSILFLSLLIFFSVISFISFLNEKFTIIYLSIFFLIFIAYLWLILLTYPNFNKRNSILSLISTRNKILNRKNIIGAEIGVYRGDYSEQILKHFNENKMSLNFFLIDQWISDEKFNEYDSQNLEAAFKHVKKRFNNNKNITILKKSSLEASKEFTDEYFDFVYIDANHDYEFVLQDLNLWFPKIKKKGVIFGDDYNRPYGVHKAIAEFSFEKKLTVHFSDNGNQYYFLKD